MTRSYLSALSILLPSATPVSPEEVASAPEWRAVSTDPGQVPASMAIEAAQPAMAHSSLPPASFDWLIHSGSGYQGTRSWPVHHAIQAAVMGPNGNAIEVRQFCAGGLTSWLIADRMRDSDRAVICTTADNWSWTDRYALSRSDTGEPFADVASAAVFGSAGFAQIRGAGTASCPHHAEVWRSHDRYWEHLDEKGFRATYASAVANLSHAETVAAGSMVRDAIVTALGDAGLMPADIDFFVPPSSRTGQPFRYLAGQLGLPWSEALYDFYVNHGYLSVSSQSAGLIHFVDTCEMPPGSTVLLVATEYHVSATALVLSVDRPPAVVRRGRVTVVH